MVRGERALLAGMDGAERKIRKAEKEGGVPEVALTQLIWGPYREQVLGLMTRLLAGVEAAADATDPGHSDN